MDLSANQAEAIRDWARRTPYVREVRLFGSRAKGIAKPNSDVDLAVTADDAGHYVALSANWEKHLSDALVLTVHIRDYARNETIRKACQECCVPLFVSDRRP